MNWLGQPLPEMPDSSNGDSSTTPSSSSEMPYKRALLSATQRAILTGEADVEDNHYWKVRSEVRNRVKHELAEDLLTLRDEEPDLFRLVMDVAASVGSLEDRLDLEWEGELSEADAEAGGSLGTFRATADADDLDIQAEADDPGRYYFLRGGTD